MCVLPFLQQSMTDGNVSVGDPALKFITVIICCLLIIAFYFMGNFYFSIINFLLLISVLWDCTRVQQLESASWLSTGEGFLTCHNDGRYISWKVTDAAIKSATEEDESKIPYGPFPCKPIGRILCKTVRNG